MSNEQNFSEILVEEVLTQVILAFTKQVLIICNFLKVPELVSHLMNNPAHDCRLLHISCL